MTKEQKLPFLIGIACLMLGSFLCGMGEVGWIFGAVPLALGIGSVAGGFTDCDPPPHIKRHMQTKSKPRRRIKSDDEIARAGAAERSAIAAAVCAGMKDGSFYKDPKAIVSGARSKFK